jgi:hypothetical protein
MHASIPAYARASFRVADMHAPGVESSPRPVVAGGPAPTSTLARPLNARPSEDDIAGASR